MADFIRWFATLGKQDVSLAGGKGANLGELAGAGFPVPPGFVITAPAFRQTLDAHHLTTRIRQQVEMLDVQESAQLDRVAGELQAQVRTLDLPAEIADAIRDAYHTLATETGGEEPFVAVRSSATAEDTPTTSFAGMNESFLNIQGAGAVLDAVRRCYASLYGARVLFYRRTEHVPEEKMSIAVIVQQMVNADAAGVLFTIHPTTNDRHLLVIEGAFGLGDAVVSGAVNPDHFEVHKDTREIVSRQIAHKDFRDVRTPAGETVREPLSDKQAEQPCVTDAQVLQLADLGIRIEAHYGAPQDIEWARAQDQLFIVQSRAITTTGQAAPETAQAGAGDVLVRGLPASPGTVSGKVHILASPAQAAELASGEILVTRMTAPDWVPLMKTAGAIVTDEGGMTSHAAIVSRELGIPCIVGARTATTTLQTGQEVTVDAREGVVYAGRRATPPPGTEAIGAPAAIITGTHLYVNLAEPEMAETVAARDVDGVGLLRAEFIMQTVTAGAHPRLLIDQGHGEALRDKLAQYLHRFARAFAPRPVIYRSLDFRSNEYGGMTGGAQYEHAEANPMLGYRGCFRDISEPDLFGMELAALKQVRAQGLPNLHLMIPFVRTANELARCKSLVDASGLTEDRTFELWVMAEVPSILYYLDAYAALGITGVSIGSNDLTQLVLGVDRDNELLAPVFDERDPAVLGAMHDIIAACHRLGLTSSICGQAPSVYPELCDRLVGWGITSISVNPDVLERTRRLIATAEQRLVLERLRQRVLREFGSE